MPARPPALRPPGGRRGSGCSLSARPGATGQWLLAAAGPPWGVGAVALVSLVAAVHSLLAQAALGAGALDGTPARPGLLVPAWARRPPCVVRDPLLGRS
ncbi:hypothetical protein [Streptomyces sp. R33]|uniref:Uncharacterized protein n=1 Tax=Streptomyces sp. R33 TaxID=3238629 RepID=A0AB39Y9W3_9ACTN